MRRALIKLTAAALTLPLILGGCSLLDSLVSGGLQGSMPPELPDVSELEQAYGGFGFRALETSAEKRLYAAIDDSAAYLSPRRFTTEAVEPERISDVLEFYKDDHPEVFWIDETEPYYYSDEDGYLTMELNYKLSGEELSAAKERLEACIEETLAQAPGGSDYEKELYVHDRLIDRCEYDSAALEAHKSDTVRADEQNVYGALADGLAVCEGYARAFQLLCSRLGLTCWVIQGQADGFENTGEKSNHIWNCVQLDGDWYQVDVTWDDVEASDITCERYLYLNLTTAEITKDHDISPLYSEHSDSSVWYNAFVPECVSTEYCYIIQHSAVLSDLDSDTPPQYLAEVSAQRADNCTFAVSDGLDFEETFDSIIDSYAYEWIIYANEQNGYSPQLSDQCTVSGLVSKRLIVLVLDYI